MVTVYAGGMILRPVTEADKPALLVVESKSTPNLSYLPAVYGMFLADAPRGEFMLVEEDGAVLGCAKYTLLPDGSAWLETLRVVPEAQGRGLGKRMYERFFELAREQGVPTMRMYTGVDNVVSKGLAGHFGFTLEETFHGFSRPVGPVRKAPAFQAVSDPVQVTDLLMPLRPAWGDFLVMNRTFTPSYRTFAPTWRGGAWCTATATTCWWRGSGSARKRRCTWPSSRSGSRSSGQAGGSSACSRPAAQKQKLRWNTPGSCPIGASTSS